MDAASSARYSVDADGEVSGPDFSRTMAALSDSDLLAEIEGGRGGVDFQAAVRAEARRRGL